MKVNDGFNEHQRVLLAMAELISRGWTQGADARDVHGFVVGASDPAAVMWCMSGAARRAANAAGYRYHATCTVWAALEACLPAGHRTVIRYNDHSSTRKENVLALIMRAVVWAGQEHPAPEQPKRPKYSFLPGAFWDFVNHKPIVVTMHLDLSTKPDQAATVVMDTA